MSEQDGTQSAAKQRRSRKTKAVSQNNGRQASAARRPANDDTEGWKAYWKAQGQLWRTEPEIDAERQTYLAERRSIMPDIEQGIYPFRGMELDRSDVEWLLATHDGGHGPVSWHEKDKKREGLDLRGANLRFEDLSGLPLNRLRGGLTDKEWLRATTEQRSNAAILFIGVNLSKAELIDAILSSADLQNSDIQGADLVGADLRGANLERAHLQKANLHGSHLEGARLYQAHLEGAHLIGARLQETSLHSAYLEGAELNHVALGNQQHIGPYLADIQWGNINLAVVDWSQVTKLGDEHKARQKKIRGKWKDKYMRLDEYREAVQANRQLAVALRNQGLNEQADYFAYRAQICQRAVLWLQGWRSRVKWLGSWFLSLLAGYGYQPGRTILWYLLVIGSFAVGYYEVTHLLHAQPYPLAWYEALILSVSSFHGRGFFQPVQSLGDPVAILASIKAVVGLIIEISFIATFTQRFFGK